ncbi:cupin domain-containing protein [Nonomuraea sp. NPDC048826]|uniref:cupin domain-containing protein n=1 Tax=Nonomuraea sp. NPDC048826 TaxID=3364347 RepID=UPI00372169C2
MDPLSDARALVAELFPQAWCALLGGSVTAGRRTPTSDLDIVVVVEGLAEPYRESLRWHDWPVDLLAHSRTSLDVWLERDFGGRQPVLARLCAEGVVLTDRSAGELERLRDELRGRLAAGPGAVRKPALDRARYVLSDLLDDLTGATDPGELAFTGWSVIQETALLALSLDERWQGSGKWLLRELRAYDPELAAALLKARETPDELAEVAGRVLERAGGRLWEGYRVTGDVFHRPLRHVTPDGLSEATVQSAGMRRLAAVSDATTGSRRLWMGQTHVPPSTHSADHHHGESETAIYVVSGTPVFVFLDGDRERRIETGPGDYVFVPPFVPHREENPDPDTEAVVVIARSTQEAIVVDLPDLRMR